MRRFRPCASRRAGPVSAAAIPRSSPHRRSRVVDGPPGGQGPDRGTYRRSAETAPPGRELSGRANLPLSAKSEWPQPRASRNRVSLSFQARGGGAGTRCPSRLVRAGGVRLFRPNLDTQDRTCGGGPGETIPLNRAGCIRLRRTPEYGCRTGRTGTGPGARSGIPFRPGSLRVPRAASVRGCGQGHNRSKLPLRAQHRPRGGAVASGR